MGVKILKVGITEKKQNTWGRLYVDFLDNGEKKFLYRNFIYGEAETYVGDGSFEKEVSFEWFDSKKIISDVDDVLDGLHNSLFLCEKRYQNLGGIPSKILLEVMADLDAGLARHVGERRGWYKK